MKTTTTESKVLADIIEHAQRNPRPAWYAMQAAQMYYKLHVQKTPGALSMIVVPISIENGIVGEAPLSMFEAVDLAENMVIVLKHTPSNYPPQIIAGC